MKTLTILGARPQFIKAAPMARAIAAHPKFNDVILHTGQHYDANMSDVFFNELGIPKPAHHLGIGGGSHGQMTGRQLEAIEAVLKDEAPDAVFVYGDTNSTLAGTLAAAKMNIPVGHIEAGLRSFNRRMPEEVNRILTDHAATWAFAPTTEAMQHLANEGITDQAHLVGDVMFDAARLFGTEAREHSNILDRLNLRAGGFRLATVHRQDNTDTPETLETIMAALRDLAQDAPLILPLHPRTRKALEATGRFEQLTQGITLTDPLGFFDIIALMQAARLILTDSGGLQKEAYFHGTPTVVLRTETEWNELVTLGWAMLAPPHDSSLIYTAISKMDGVAGDETTAPYGDGYAAEKIISIVTGS